MSEPRQEPDQPTPIPPQPDQPSPDEPDEEEKEEGRPGYTLHKIHQTHSWRKHKGIMTQALWVIRRNGRWYDAHLSKQYAKQRLGQLNSR